MADTLPPGVRAPEVSPPQPFRVGVVCPNEPSTTQVNTLRQLFDQILRVQNFTVVIDAACQQTIRMAREYADVTALILDHTTAPWKRNPNSISREEVLYNAELLCCGIRRDYRDVYPENVKIPTKEKRRRVNLDPLPGKMTPIHLGQQVTRLTGVQSSLFQQYGIDITHNGNGRMLAAQLYIALLTSMADALILFNCPKISRILGDLNDTVAGSANHFPHCLIVGLEKYSAQAIGTLWGISEENNRPWYHIAPDEAVDDTVAGELVDYLLFGEKIFHPKPISPTRVDGSHVRHATPEQVQRLKKRFEQLQQEQRGPAGQAQDLVRIIKKNALQRYFGG